MHIFVDESGTFVVPSGSSNISVVGALIIPDRRLGTDIGKIMSESFRFSSKTEDGLELVDILTNATRRALVGNLKDTGWKNIPRVMIHRGQHYIRMLAMTKYEPAIQARDYLPVLKHFSRGGRAMLLPHMYKQG
ncbi:hypothetical protein H8A95_24585 [Bradyrhizobium sp. Pear76]|uniref:hypothetical protein n=1 Tax=Bradyrhizobium oropedii TaxID=1571201 RepID=UPI001E5B656A|nr:hypothetical protein [Bradyrhizobium oropedii]MCC8965407.1 hypothetical protein [Bradyrhizobium oropedii]